MVSVWHNLFVCKLLYSGDGAYYVIRQCVLVTENKEQETFQVNNHGIPFYKFTNTKDHLSNTNTSCFNIMYGVHSNNLK